MPLADFYKLVGFEFEGRDDPRRFLYTIYWLKTYDSGCPNGDEGYDRNGGQPCEAIDVSVLLNASFRGKAK